MRILSILIYFIDIMAHVTKNSNIIAEANNNDP